MYIVYHYGDSLHAPGIYPGSSSTDPTRPTCIFKISRENIIVFISKLKLIQVENMPTDVFLDYPRPLNIKDERI